MSKGKNRVLREELERIYGKGCMFQKAYVSQRLKQLGVSQAYTVFKKKYTLNQQKTLEKRMTLHHLKHVSEGGRTTLDNGAVVNELAHRYLHSLPRREEEAANNMLRDWKRDKDNGFEECEVKLVPEEELEQEAGEPFELHIATGSFELDAKMQPKFKPHKAKKKKYNRAKQKKKNRKIIKRYYGNER